MAKLEFRGEYDSDTGQLTCYIDTPMHEIKPGTTFYQWSSQECSFMRFSRWSEAIPESDDKYVRPTGFEVKG